MNCLSSLKPERLWYYFREISKIPRMSLDEERVIDYIAGVAKGLGLEYRKDSVNNLIVYKKTKNSNNKILTIQSHVDMVGVKVPGSKHDFSKDPIELYIENGWVRAKDTTLGADNGIGVAVMMALMEEDIDNIDLEFLFTINEESGMTGARNLNEDFLKGRMLLNLDTEEWGGVYVSCAGATDTVVHFPKDIIEHYSDFQAVSISIDSLLGGHSGIEIHSGKRNAIKLLARVLRRISLTTEMAIASVHGGTKRNVIPSSASAVLLIKASDLQKIKDLVNECYEVFQTEFGEIEKKFKLTLTEAFVENKKALSINRSSTFANLLMALPNGVLSMSPSIEGLVETSTNIGVIEETDDEILIRSLSRSSIDSSIDELIDRINVMAGLCGANLEIVPGYPGWKPNLDSDLLKTVTRTYKSLYGTEPKIMAIHAGLETAIIGKKFDDMDMVSIGPNLFHPHSPDEKVEAESAAKLYELTREVVKSF